MPLNTILFAAYFARMAYILPQLDRQPWVFDGTVGTAPMCHSKNLDWMGKPTASNAMPKVASSVVAEILNKFTFSPSDSYAKECIHATTR